MALVKEILLWLCSTHGQKNLFSGLEIFFSKASPGGLRCTHPNLVAPEMASVEMNGVMRRGENINVTFSLFIAPKASDPQLPSGHVSSKELQCHCLGLCKPWALQTWRIPLVGMLPTSPPALPVLQPRMP